MICLRSQLELKHDVSAETVWSLILAWRTRSRNTPAQIRTWLSEVSLQKSFEKPQSTAAGSVAVELISSGPQVFAFRLSEENGTFITTICFNGTLERANFSLEIETKGAGEHPFSRPNIFSDLVSYLADGYSQKAQVEGDYEVLAASIMGNKKTVLPIVYVSQNKNGTYCVSPDALAEKLFGVAQVYREPNASYAVHLAERTEKRAAYNGAVGIYWNNYATRIMPERLGDGDFFHRISRISVMGELSDGLSYGSIVRRRLEQLSQQIQEQASDLGTRLQQISLSISTATIVQQTKDIIAKVTEAQLKKQIEALKSQIEGLSEASKLKDEKINAITAELENERNLRKNAEEARDEAIAEKEGFIKTFDDDKTEYEQLLKQAETETKELQNELSEVTNERDYYKSVFTASEKKDISLALACPLPPLTPWEITDFLKTIIWRELSEYKKMANDEKRRKTRRYEVLKALSEANPDFSPEHLETEKCRAQLKKAFEDVKKQENALVRLGFMFVRDEGGHPIYRWHGRGTCEITLSRSPKKPEEYAKNMFSDAERTCLLT